jgi:DNA-binding response OmpR family regulator
MQQHELLEFLLDTFSELATLHAAAAATAERAWSVLAKHDEADLKGVSCGDRQRGFLPHDRLMVDPTTFTVEWQGQRCDLGPSILFKLIQRLARRPGRYFTYDILMEDVWEQRCSNTTVRSAVKRLRQALRDAGMPELATAIRGRGECYGVFLDGDYS